MIGSAFYNDPNPGVAAIAQGLFDEHFFHDPPLGRDPEEADAYAGIDRRQSARKAFRLYAMQALGKYDERLDAQRLVRAERLLAVAGFWDNIAEERIADAWMDGNRERYRELARELLPVFAA